MLPEQLSVATRAMSIAAAEVFENMFKKLKSLSERYPNVLRFSNASGNTVTCTREARSPREHRRERVGHPFALSRRDRSPGAVTCGAPDAQLPEKRYKMMAEREGFAPPRN